MIPPDFLSPQLRGEAAVSGEQARYALKGEMDLACYESLQARLREIAAAPGVTEVVVDLTEVSFVDSTGLRALLEIQSETHTRGQELRLSNPRGAPRRLIELSGLSDLFEVEVTASE